MEDICIINGITIKYKTFLQIWKRLRITYINDTMMNHPIHLHGMWSDLGNR